MSSLPPLVLGIPSAPASAAGGVAVRFPPPLPGVPRLTPPPFFTASLLVGLLDLLSDADPMEEMEEGLLAALEAMVD